VTFNVLNATFNGSNVTFVLLDRRSIF